MSGAYIVTVATGKDDHETVVVPSDGMTQVEALSKALNYLDRRQGSGVAHRDIRRPTTIVFTHHVTE